MLQRLVIIGLTGFASLLIPFTASAANLTLTYHYKHFLFTINTAQQHDWESAQEMWTYNGEPVTPPQELRVDGDGTQALPDGFQKTETLAFNKQAVMQTIQTIIGDQLNRDTGKVTISRTSTGVVVFDGVGFPGRSVDISATADLSIAALRDRTTDIILPVSETQPEVVVADPDLQQQGIKELVTIGESDFSRSPNNRRHNIAVGLSKFNGHLIPKDSIFSFDQTLGKVDGTTGYLKELVIKGDLTIPDYGGGLCQVSTTAYRGAWEYGFPIVKRINHSYMVSHYAPQGTDATVYPPNIDMKFKNDSNGALLMQTYAADDKAYFLYYGTKDDRTSDVIGPFVWGQTPPLADRTQPTLDLPPGATKKVGERVPGEHAAWFRTVAVNGKTATQGTYSIYEPRPLYYLIGVASIPAGETGATIPTDFLND